MIKKRIQVWVILFVFPLIFTGIGSFVLATSYVAGYIRNNDIAAAVWQIVIGLAVAYPFIMMAINAIYAYTTEIFVDETGVSWKNLFHKTHLDWKEIKTFGISSSFLTYRRNTNAIYFAGYVLPEKSRVLCREYSDSAENSRQYVDINFSLFNFRETIRKMSLQNKREIVMFFKYTPEDWTYITSLEPVKKLCEEYYFYWDATGKGRNCYYDPNEEPPKLKEPVFTLKYFGGLLISLMIINIACFFILKGFSGNQIFTSLGRVIMLIGIGILFYTHRKL